MERPRGLEPPPTAWQAVVLPLYYGRSGLIFYSTLKPQLQASVLSMDPTRTLPSVLRVLLANAKVLRIQKMCSSDALLDLNNASGLYYRGPLLAVRKPLGLFLISVHAAEFFSICIVDSHEEMLVLAASIFSKSGLLSSFHVIRLPAYQYLRFATPAQAVSQLVILSDIAIFRRLRPLRACRGASLARSLECFALFLPNPSNY